jgi:lipoate-protein ligase A
MLFIQNDNTNPYFNLALEEYLIKEFNEDCFMLWQNEPCVVIGRNQNPLAEINLDFVEKNNIKVAKRLSGGGAVYHDLGNLNFTFIINDTENSLRNYKKFLTPIIEALATLGIKAEISERNDLLIDGLKFSGNAQYKHKNRLLHHGTILFSSNLNNVRMALTPETSIKGRWVKSTPSPIANLQEHIKKHLDINELKASIKNQIKLIPRFFNNYELTITDIKKTTKFVNEKYATDKWIYKFHR